MKEVEEEKIVFDKTVTVNIHIIFVLSIWERTLITFTAWWSQG